MISVHGTFLKSIEAVMEHHLRNKNEKEISLLYLFVAISPPMSHWALVWLSLLRSKRLCTEEQNKNRNKKCYESGERGQVRQQCYCDMLRHAVRLFQSKCN